MGRAIPCFHETKVRLDEGGRSAKGDSMLLQIYFKVSDENGRAFEEMFRDVYVPAMQVQEGYIGLLRAARRYDPDRGIRFTTYARWWVRAQMTRALETAGRMVRLPGGAVEQLRNLQRIMERMDLAGVAYSLEDVAAEIGIDKSRAELLLSHRGIVSIDQPDDDGLKVGDRLPTSGERVDPHDNASLIQEITQMHDALDRVLDERERYILTEHFGLNGRNARTMADIGKTMGLSRERVRQIECAALRRLRNNI